MIYISVSLFVNDEQMMNLIELQNVWKTYVMGTAEVHALRGLNLKVNEGEFLAIQGPSGSGKSTAMSLIGCLDIPTKGKICLGGRDIATLPESKLAQIRGKKIGFVFQKFNLLSNLTARENVMLPMIFQGYEHKDQIARSMHFLKEVGLGERQHHKPAQLSGGQQQRVAIARALAADPEIILADEPTGNLDSETGKQIMEILIALHTKKNKTIILVTHDDHLAHYAQRIVYLKDGYVQKEKQRLNRKSVGG